VIGHDLNFASVYQCIHRTGIFCVLNSYVVMAMFVWLQGHIYSEERADTGLMCKKRNMENILVCERYKWGEQKN
jgi:hypothetical protein